jgi:hypothetical protein
MKTKSSRALPAISATAQEDIEQKFNFEIGDTVLQDSEGKNAKPLVVIGRSVVYACVPVLDLSQPQDRDVLMREISEADLHESTE